jgi:hypothetical protein
VAEVVHVDVDPRAPLGRVDREARPTALIRRQRLEEREGSVLDRAGFDTCGGEVAQSAANHAVGRHAEQRPLQFGGPLIDDVEDLGVGGHDEGPRRHRRHRPYTEGPPWVDSDLVGGADRDADRARETRPVRAGRT